MYTDVRFRDYQMEKFCTLIINMLLILIRLG